MALAMAARRAVSGGCRRWQQSPSVVSRIPHTRLCSGGAQKPVGLWAQYNAALEKYPLPVKMLTSGVIALLGDAGCQLLVERVDTFSWQRQAEIGAMGLLLVGPGLHAWYGFLFRLIPAPGFVNVLKRLALDQILFAPIAVGTSLSFLSAAQGQVGDIPRRLVEQVPGAVLNNWKLWPATQMVNFTFVPIQHQVLFSNLVSVVWNGYLSWSANQERSKGAAPPSAP